MIKREREVHGRRKRRENIGFNWIGLRMDEEIEMVFSLELRTGLERMYSTYKCSMRV
jgi:hypothetical protein